MIKKKFENLDDLLEKIGMAGQAWRLKEGRFVRQGEYYNKSLLSVIGEPKIIEPFHLNSGGAKTEASCEIYLAEYGDKGILITVLPLRRNEEKRDSREPIFLLKKDLANYFLSAKMGYLGYNEMTFPDKLNVVKSLVQFPINGFEALSSDETLHEARMIEGYLFRENYSSENERDKFSGWKKQFGDIIVTQIKADDGHKNSRYNPMFFLAIHHTE